MAQFPAESVLALHHIALENDSAAIAGTDDARNRSLAAVGAEDGIVSPECGSVGVVQIGHWLAELVRQTFANIEAGPVGVDKVCGASSAELA